MASKKNNLRTLTTLKEKSKRFDFINGQFMEKYLELVWFARSDPDKLVEEEQYEIVPKVIDSLQKVADKYPKDVVDLCEDETNWQHGFNSGVLAYSRFLADYVEDTLWEVSDINEDIAEYEKVITIDGVEYIEFDGRQDAFDRFPELDT